MTFRFDSIGARKFAEITSANVGRPFAIVLDGKVLSAPVIREPITGGSGQISGSFTVEETVTLSALLRAGALPAPLTVIEERTVGPDLGGDVIKMGIYTGIAGFAAVVLFMVALYGSWGMIANFALLLHLILTFGVLNIIGATLTLPGIAGIILGIGFGVDANILINERIREEAKKGLSAFAALDNGFKRAYSTIVDANVTSLIATSLLFMFGSGPVKGFAVTMFLGTCLSMFTAVSVTRILMAAVVRRQKLKTIKIEPLVALLPGEDLDRLHERTLSRHRHVDLPVGCLGRAVHEARTELRHRLQGRHPGRDHHLAAGRPRASCAARSASLASAR